jgi:hypothetical protein
VYIINEVRLRGVRASVVADDICFRNFGSKFCVRKLLQIFRTRFSNQSFTDQACRIFAVAGVNVLEANVNDYVVDANVFGQSVAFPHHKYAAFDGGCAPASFQFTKPCAVQATPSRADATRILRARTVLPSRGTSFHW